MGNCAYKNGNDLEALLFWKRAEKLGNMKVIHASTNNSKRVLQKLSIADHKPHTMLTSSPVVFQILFFCIFSVFLVSNRWLWRTKKFLLLALLSIGVIATGTVSYFSYAHAITTYGIIMSEEGMLYAGPNNGYHQLAPIAKGNVVVILADKKEWKKIRWNGQVGWIQNDKIEAI